MTKDFEPNIIGLPKAIEEYKNNGKDKVLQWAVVLDDQRSETNNEQTRISN